MATRGRKTAKRAKAPRVAKPLWKSQPSAIQSTQSKTRKPKPGQPEAETPQSETAALKELLRAAEDRETATAEILKVIASSPSDVQPVFEAIAESAKRLLGGFSTSVFNIVDDMMHLSAFTPTNAAADAALKARFPSPLSARNWGKLIRNGKMVVVPDTEADGAVSPDLRESARMRGYRSMLHMPLLRERKSIGLISVTRVDSGPFPAHHIQLLQTFAAQAVVAIENTRLFNEVQAKTADLSESLQQQTATADVLKVISRSAFDLQTVLDTLVESAARLCDADVGQIFQPRNGFYRLAADCGLSAKKKQFLHDYLFKPGNDTVVGRVLLESKTIHQTDPNFSLAGDPEPARTRLGVPLLRDGALMGVFVLTRREAQPFSHKQLELVQTFADQAVIAIENVRLFDEVQARTHDLEESLEYQTATSDVLNVISRLTLDVTPVFRAVVQKGVELCSADNASVLQREGDVFRYVANAGDFVDEKTFMSYWGTVELRPGRGSLTGRVVVERRSVQIDDIDNDPEYEAQYAAHKVAGAKTHLGVPLLKDGEPIGLIIARRLAVRPFTNKQIKLLETFAAQAVIAIENARLFNETQEALERQTATADILKVIASSPDNAQPVFEAIASTANRLVEGLTTAVYSLVDDTLHLSAFTRTSAAADAAVKASYPRPLSAVAWAEQIRNGQIAHILDTELEWAELPDLRDMARLRGFRSSLIVPLLRNEVPIGVVTVTRVEPGRFAEHHVQLLKTFADQAVIAIGNVRLFNEVQARTKELGEALTFQTGSSNILSVIASSPTDVAPVLNAIVRSATELCEAYDAVVLLQDGDDLRFSAHHGPIPTHVEKWPISRNWTAGRAFVDQKPVHVRDIFSDEGADFSASRELSQQIGSHGVRSVLSVPLLRDNESIGAIVLRRTEVHPFSDKQITLLQTFAHQAVIAIGNVRLFDEVQAKTRDLSESLQQQTATADVLKVISSSPGELEPVFQVLLENAVRLCEAQFGVLCTYDVRGFQYVSARNASLEYTKHMQQRGSFQPASGTMLDQLMRTKQLSHTADEATAVVPGPAGTLGGARSLVGVPMLKNGELRGAIIIYRTEVLPFADKQIELLRNFAAQAVIAIDNTRLLNELRQRTDDLTRSLKELHTAQERLIQTEKLASLGQLTAGIAHEIKNPLNFVNNFSALSAELTDELNDVLKPVGLERKVREEVSELTGLLKDNLQKVVQHGKRADSIVKNMLLHSREGSREHRLAEINSLLDESLNLAYHGARAENGDFNIMLQRDFDESAGAIEVFPQEITRVFLNLISNGFYAATKRKTEGGEPGFEPIISATTKSRGDTVEIRIRDNGVGIPAEVKEKIFNPFFTTKPAGEGTGLGLSMSHDIIVKQHGGSIDVESVPGAFTEFTVILPRTSNQKSKQRGQS